MPGIVCKCDNGVMMKKSQFHVGLYSILFTTHSFVMIRVNYVRFNIAAAHAQSRDLDIQSLLDLYALGLNIWVGFGHLQAWVLKCHSVLGPIFDSCLRIVLCSVDTWVLVSTKLDVK